MARQPHTRTTISATLPRDRPLDRTQQWEYDPAGNLLNTIDARDVEVDYDYYDNNQLQDVTFDGGSVSYTYDDIGRREHMYDSTGTTTWNYDAASNVTSVNSPNGTVAYTYDDANDRQTMTLPSDRTFTYGYDATSGMLSSITDWQDARLTSPTTPTAIARASPGQTASTAPTHTTSRTA